MASSPPTSQTSTAANPSAQDSAWGWQQNSGSFGELGKFLFESRHLSDVVLHCGVTAAANINAHKFILAARSPVFEQMFFEDQKSSDSTHILYMDEEKAVLEILVKLIYGFDHTLLLTIHNVSHVIRAAEKYKVHVAISCCERWIGTNMNATSCLSWLETAHLFPPGISGSATSEKCWNYIDHSAAEVLRSPKFLETDHSLLLEILKRNGLHVDEYALYEAALRWAVWACERGYLSNHPQPKRAALGDALFQIRFTLMSAKEFGEGPAESGILEPEEVSSILLHMVTDKKPPIKFVTEPRIIVASGTFQVERFPATYGKRIWVYEGNVLDSVSFSVDRDITLVGCGIYTCGKEEHEVHIKVFTGVSKTLRLHIKDVLPSLSSKFLTGPAGIQFLKFNNELVIPRSTPCTIQCSMTGKETDHGVTGKTDACAEVILDNGNVVLYRFSFVAGPLDGQDCNRSLTSRGQIPTILFRP